MCAPHPGRRPTPRRWLVRTPHHDHDGLRPLLTDVRATRHTPGAGLVERPGVRHDLRPGPVWPTGCQAACRGTHPAHALAWQARSPGPPAARGQPAWVHGDALPRGHTRYGLQAHPGVVRAPAGVSDWACGTPGGGDTPPSPAHSQASGPGTGAPPAWPLVRAASGPVSSPGPCSRTGRETCRCRVATPAGLPGFSPGAAPNFVFDGAPPSSPLPRGPLTAPGRPASRMDGLAREVPSSTGMRREYTAHGCLEPEETVLDAWVPSSTLQGGLSRQGYYPLTQKTPE